MPTQRQDPPVTEMLERVIRAIVDVIAERIPDDRSALDATKAAPAMAYAVLAVLREPTEAMLRVGNIMCGDEFGYDAEYAWDAMIDAALEDRR